MSFEITNRTLPLCTEFACDVYWTQASIIMWSLIIARLSIAVLILLLGTKMERDFMRSITVSMFLPILFTEIFSIYCEVASFLALFCPDSESMTKHQISYTVWTPTFLYVLWDYIHYNSLVMMVMLLHVCRLACREGDEVNPFPVNTLCLVLQIIPLFLCILIYVEDGASIALKIISVLARVVTVVCFLGVTVQAVMAIPLLFRLLPYDHAASVDMQLRDARSRLSWTLVYMIIPYVCMLPFTVEAVTWISVMGHSDNDTMKDVQGVTELLKYLIHSFRSTWMVVITMAFLPPYRRAVPLLFCSCPCCPMVKVDPLPRKPVDTSLMYKHADI